MVAAARIHTALAADFQMQVVRMRNMLLQQRQSQLVAGTDTQNLMPVIPCNRNDLREIGAQ